MRPHDFSASRISGNVTCDNCKLLPLDEDDFSSSCVPDLPTVLITAPERDGNGYIVKADLAERLDLNSTRETRYETDRVVNALEWDGRTGVMCLCDDCHSDDTAPEEFTPEITATGVVAGWRCDSCSTVDTGNNAHIYVQEVAA